MELYLHTLNTLFKQLGLASTDQAIQEFVDIHKPLPRGQLLYEADFWTPAQADFLKQAWDEDADWVEVVDMLDAQLRDQD